MRRLIPERIEKQPRSADMKQISDVERLFDIGEDAISLSESDKVLMTWFYGKCASDEAWCR